jgi:hypothetical protein
MHDPSVSQSRPRLGCFLGTFSPSRRHLIALEPAKLLAVETIEPGSTFRTTASLRVASFTAHLSNRQRKKGGRSRP